MTGIHHVTAISGNAARNLDFYTHVLGLRFVKKTVNFDDPGTYHLYYGDSEGHPGTILTFFPWEHAAPGRAGVGFTQETAFRVPVSSIGYWTHRFVDMGVTHEALEKRFGEPVLPFKDLDGLTLALVGTAGAETEPAWQTGDISAEHAIRGFHGVTLLLEDASPTASVLTDVLGFNEAGDDGPLIRFRASETIGGYVDIREAKGFLAGQLGRGSVHHIAFRAADDAAKQDLPLGRAIGPHRGLEHDAEDAQVLPLRDEEAKTVGRFRHLRRRQAEVHEHGRCATTSSSHR